MNFKGRNLFLGFVIMSQMFSPVVLLVGISQLMNTLHLNDTILGLMLINAAFNQAFAIWLLRGTSSRSPRKWNRPPALTDATPSAHSGTSCCRWPRRAL